MALTFTRATKAQAKARIALDGPSGSGKTYTALTIGTALGHHIAVIDTEHRSASKYADIFTFDTLPLDTYNPQILIQALAAATAAGYDVVVIDSLSHFWMGSGGMLEQVDKAAKRSGGHGMSGWKEMRPVERQMVEALLAYPGHIICTLRVKTDWVEGETTRGKRQMLKVGTKAEQREGLEYEFDIVGSLDLDNELTIVKSRCRALSGEVIKKPDSRLGDIIREWLEDGTDPGLPLADVRAQVLAADTTYQQLLDIYQREETAGRLGAALEDADGQPTTLGDLIKALGKARKPAGS